MSDHIGDANKMVSETPRMKAAQMAAMEHGTGDVWRVGCDIERELNAANEMFKKLNIHALDLTDRIKRLEDRINRASTAFFADGSDRQTAAAMLAILEEERNKP